MWLEKILEAKKEKGLSVKQISERTPSHIPPDTVNHILKCKTKAPRIDTLLEIGEAVGLTPHELFAETTSVAADFTLVALQIELEKIKEERNRLAVENSLFREKIDALKDEIIYLHAYYIKKEQAK